VCSVAAILRFDRAFWCRGDGLAFFELSRCDIEFDWTAPRRGAVVVLQTKETINDQATISNSIAPQATSQRS
jgi:hypothetical protein